MKILEYKSNESFKLYKEIYGCLVETYKQFKAMFRVHSTIKRMKKIMPKYWHLTFYYSENTENQINFWHNANAKKETNPSEVYKKLCEDVCNELDIKMTKTWGTWNDKIESLTATGYYKGYSIGIHQYQADHCDFIIVEKKVKQVLLTGDCVNF